MPAVSVIIPNYNCGAYIGKALDSILRQSFQDWEILICDDGSTDNSIEVISLWQKWDNRIKLFINDRNEGHIFTYNRLFNQAQGDYILIQDADDWSVQNRIEKQLEVLTKFNVALCLCNAIFHSETEPDNMQPRTGSGFIDINTEEVWAPATLMFKRSILDQVKGFSDYFTRATSMDRYFIMDALTNYPGYYLDEYLYHVLVRPNSDHRSVELTDKSALRKLVMHDVYLHLKQQRIETGTDWLLENNRKSLQQYEERLLGNKSYLSDKIRVFACIQIDHNKKSKGWKLLRQAIWLAPFHIRNYRSLTYLLRKLFA